MDMIIANVRGNLSSCPNVLVSSLACVHVRNHLSVVLFSEGPKQMREELEMLLGLSASAVGHDQISLLDNTRGLT